MKKRKTIAVKRVKDLVNHILANGSSGPDERIGLSFLLETILHETGNYQGFNYLDWLNGGSERWRADGEPGGIKDEYLGDQTRRVYY